jgi:inorganic pyrophosphatase
MEKTKLEAWLDGYDQRKNDLLAWVNDGSDTAASIASLVPKLDQAVREIRNKVQADAALADLAAVEAAMAGTQEFPDAAPPPATPAFDPASFASAPSAPTPAPSPAPQTPPSAAEGILGALSFMDQKFPQSTPAPESTNDADKRNKTSPLPAVFDLLKSGSSSETSEPEAPEPASTPSSTFEAPAPQPTATPSPAFEPSPAPQTIATPIEAPSSTPSAPEVAGASAMKSNPLDVFDRVISLSQTPASTAPSPAPAVESTPTPSHPAPSTFAPSTPVAPVAAHASPASAVAPVPSLEPWNPPGASAPSVPPPSGLDVIVSAAAPVQAPAPEASPSAIATLDPPVSRPKRKPRVHDRPQGETRRAALDGVGAGPETPFLLHAVVEIPRGGGMGYVYDDENDNFIVVDHAKAADVPALEWVAAGFVPETVSDDGAHLDAFVLSSGATGPGELLRVRPLAYLRRADGDHKLFCVPEKHQAQSVSELDQSILEACAEWKNPTGISGGTWCDAEKTRDLIRRCLA